jgi:hypothetical protein
VSNEHPAFLIILGNLQGLAYVLREERMAFSPKRRVRLDSGDHVFLYTTRGLFGNPKRDRSRIIGVAEVISAIKVFDSELYIDGRIYISGCKLKLKGLAPLGEGLVMNEIVESLDMFKPDPQTWSIRLRRSLVPLGKHDSKIISDALQNVIREPKETTLAYLDRAMRLPRVARAK